MKASDPSALISREEADALGAYRLRLSESNSNISNSTTARFRVQGLGVILVINVIMILVEPVCLTDA